MIWAILIGFVVGAIAKFLMPGRDPGGIVVTILLGIGGSMFANWLGINMGFYGAGEYAGLIGAVIGAMLLLVIYRLIVGRGKRD
ncbi:MAG: GlsB/YeaQ/YmgE family stress response membrane protein [Pseudobdellovibrionaceae bacterium]